MADAGGVITERHSGPSGVGHPEASSRSLSSEVCEVQEETSTLLDKITRCLAKYEKNEPSDLSFTASDTWKGAKTSPATDESTGTCGLFKGPRSWID